MFGGQLKSSDIGWVNNAIFSKYLSLDKSYQGQTNVRLLDRKHFLSRLFAWRVLLEAQTAPAWEQQ